MKHFLILTGTLVAAEYVWGQWIVKKEDGSGFIEQAPGFGLDDLLKGAFGAGLVWGVGMFVPGATKL